MGIIDRALADIDRLYGRTELDNVKIHEQLEVPEYDDLPNSAVRGQVAYATGNGSDSEGVYHYDGAGWIQGNGSGGGGETTAPTITSYTATNPSSQDIASTFESDEQLANIQTDITGPETATLNESDYTEHPTGLGTYVYSATYSTTTDGDYTLDLTTAADHAGNDGSGATTTVSVTTTTVIEDFEDGDIAEYSLDTSLFTAQTSTVYNNSYALEGASSGSNGTIVTTNYSLSSGNTYRVNVRSDGASSNPQPIFGVQDTSSVDGYMCSLNINGDSLRLYEVTGGSFTQLAEDTSPTWSLSTWYELEFDWGSGGSLTLTAYDTSGNQLAQVSASDSTYSSGGLGFRYFNDGTSSETAYYDYTRIGDAAGTGPASESWSTASENPLISSHGDPDWIKVNGEYYVYTVETDPTFGVEIDLYTSTDGVSFTEHPNSPIITTSNSGWDSSEISDPSIEKYDGTFYLYWSDNQDDFGVATAPSPEGPFTRSSNNPILSITQSWEGTKMTEPHVREHNGTLYMTYTGATGSGEAIGLATSTDGESWTKESTNPIYNPGDVNDQCHIYDDGTWHLYFTDKSTLNIDKVTSTDITSFSGSGTEVLSTSASDYSPAIRYDHTEDSFFMYWHPDSGTGGTDESIDLATSPALDE